MTAGRPGNERGVDAVRTRPGHRGQGYEIVANVGDQRSDLDGRAALRRFKLPNPMDLIPSA